MAQDDNGNPIGIQLYGVIIHDCIASGDLAKMKEVRGQAEKQLAQYGDLRAALEVLKAEIAKAEAGGR